MLEGFVKVGFVINREGNVESVADRGSDLPDAQVVACVVQRYREIKFPKPEGRVVTVVYPIRFAPG